MKKWGLLLILLLSLLPRTTFAEETADAICIEGETEGLDTDAVDAATEEMDAGVSFRADRRRLCPRRRGRDIWENRDSARLI